MRLTRLALVLAIGIVATPYVFDTSDDHPVEHPHIVANADAMIPVAPTLPRTGWTVTATSAETTAFDGKPANVLDGDPATIWHTRTTSLPQSITIDLRRTQRVSGLAYTPRPGGGNGTIGRYEVRLSVNGTTWGEPVSAGTAADDATVKTMSFAVTGARFVRLTALTEAGDRGPWASAGELNVLGDPGAPVPSARLARTGWTATASDQETLRENGRASNVLDGNPASIWHSRYVIASALPHWITIDLKAPTVLNGLVYRPRPAANANGRIGEYRVSVSNDGQTFSAPVSSGVWADDAQVKDAAFAGPVTARYVRLTALTEAGNRGPWTSAAEIDLLGPVGADPALSRVGWTATATSEWPGHPASALVDGKPETLWHSRDGGPLPQGFTVDLQREQAVSAIVVTPRADGANGRIGQYTVSVSTDGTAFTQAATGTWADDGTAKSAVLAGAPTARYVRVTAVTEAGGRGPWSSATEFHAYGKPAPISTAPLNRDGWTATASDFEAAGENGSPANVLDGATGTIWHSKWTAPAAPLPHWITLDMQEPRAVAGIAVMPRGDSGNGRVGRYEIAVSTDGTFGAPIASGTWADSSAVQTALLDAPVQARYVRLTALTEAGNRGPWSSAAEINVLTPAAPPNAAEVGKWGAIKGFPLVPVATALLPNNKLLAWSAYSADTFGGSHGYTQTAILDLATGQVTQRRVDNTGHDMFCPGTSVLPDGRVLVTGGSDAKKASIYNPFTDTWTAAAELTTARGYQGQTTLSTGEAFTVGGSWSGGEGGKNGEVYSPATNSWRPLPGVQPGPFMTADPRGAYRADNHGWFFAVADGRVFHAGPSRRMNWVSTSGTGSVTDAGPRGDSPDAMNGNAVMYDVGKILTLGGATAYQDVDATNRAYTIDITTGTASVTRVGDMSKGRAFANSVVLPDGKVLVIGGQSRPVPFSDQTAVLTPELWDPATGQFTELAPMAVPRTYHSVANLLPDGTVFSGGGGLCGDCATNHHDGQVFTPPYLLNPDGTAKQRPSITAAPTTAALGSTVTVTTDRDVTSFALIRMGSVTHSVDNDQRRIPLSTVPGTSHTLTVPADPGIALPGHYLLFALDAAGVPSVAATVRIG
ncbi:discoidin domain-containing protein [Actinokineospora sp. HUAS TT18]|uniref:discoidin domain-containing protein n=1 Tax=Actinokineospora sp. HUAS TT18 TaxID=3447451 RepID=UPI003F51CEDE